VLVCALQAHPIALTPGQSNDGLLVPVRRLQAVSRPTSTAVHTWPAKAQEVGKRLGGTPPRQNDGEHGHRPGSGSELADPQLYVGRAVSPNQVPPSRSLPVPQRKVHHSRISINFFISKTPSLVLASTQSLFITNKTSTRSRSPSKNHC